MSKYIQLSMPWEVGTYYCFLELLSELYKCRNYSWFRLDIGCELSRSLKVVSNEKEGGSERCQTFTICL